MEARVDSPEVLWLISGVCPARLRRHNGVSYSVREVEDVCSEKQISDREICRLDDWRECGRMKVVPISAGVLCDIGRQRA